jgi:single-strand DNA-binding protein
MAQRNINKWIGTGRLTRDPELRALPSGTSVCEMRLAVNGMGRSGEVGYIDVSAYGANGEACNRYLTKGSKVGVDGRIEYGEWEADGGGKRHSYSVVANTVEFLTPRSEEESEEPADEREQVAA